MSINKYYQVTLVTLAPCTWYIVNSKDFPKISPRFPKDFPPDFPNISPTFPQDFGASKQWKTWSVLVWSGLENDGKQWKTMENNGKQWNTMENYGKQWKTSPDHQMTRSPDDQMTR